jgi:8-oxo-dGTP diphosphatase
MEDSADAVRREALEEAGAVLSDVQYIGCYQITERNEVRWADCYAATVAELVEIQVAEESSDRRFMRPEELPQHYHVWNELTDLVFRHSQGVVERLGRHKG